MSSFTLQGIKRIMRFLNKLQRHNDRRCSCKYSNFFLIGQIFSCWPPQITCALRYFLSWLKVVFEVLLCCLLFCCGCGFSGLYLLFISFYSVFYLFSMKRDNKEIKRRIKGDIAELLLSYSPLVRFVLCAQQAPPRLDRKNNPQHIPRTS